MEPDDIQLVPTRMKELDVDEDGVPGRAPQPFVASWSNRKCRYLVYFMVALVSLVIIFAVVAAVSTGGFGTAQCSETDFKGAHCSKYATCLRSGDMVQCTCKAGYVGNGQYCAVTLQQNNQIGPQAYAAAGFSVWTAGDINHDGYSDVIIGAPDADGWTLGDKAGAVYVLFGQPGDTVPAVDLGNISHGMGFAIPGIYANGGLGFYVSGNFDFNEDGYKDIAFSASFPKNPQTAPGTVYVLFGHAGFNFPMRFNLSTLDGTNGFAIHGANLGDNFGLSVAGAHDISLDGYDDLIIGAPGYQNSRGIVYCIFGTDSRLTHGEFNVTNPQGLRMASIYGPSFGDKAGVSVNGIGDFNFDGAGDLIIGADHAFDNKGAAFVLWGRTLSEWLNPGFITLATITSNDGFAFVGSNPGDLTGYSVAGAGDVNGDNIKDIVIGAYGASIGERNSGAAYVMFGEIILFPVALNASFLTGSTGFTIVGADMGDQFGVSVAPAGDFNNDGYGDFVVGAFGASPQDMIHAGAAYLILGSAGPFSKNMNMYTFVNGQDGFLFYGTNAGDEMGSSVSGAGDFNGDGYSDYIVGVSSATMQSRTSCGYTELTYGRSLQ